MAITFVQGYLAEITVDGTDISVSGSSAGITRSKNVLNKPLFGSNQMNKLGGQSDGSFTVDGHVTVEEYAKLETIWAKSTSLTYLFQIGDATGATDVGTLGGSCVATNFEVSATADGEWDWSMDFGCDGETTFTAGTPTLLMAEPEAAGKKKSA